MNHKITAVFCGFTLLVSNLWGVELQSQDPTDSVAYLMVIDHSGSMKDLDGSGNGSRWAVMQRRTIDFIETMPAESRLWTAVFDTSAAEAKLSNQFINTAADRKRAQERIRNSYGPPGGNTALYDTLWLAFEEAERLSAANPDRYICVMVYSDGEDTTSKYKQKDLENRFAAIRGSSENTWLFLTQLGGNKPPLGPGGGIIKGEPKDPVSIKLNPTKLVFGSPAAGNIKTSFRMSGLEKNLKHLVGSKFNMVFEPGPGLTGRLRETSYKFVDGEVDFEIIFSGGVSADKAYTGKLSLEWPELDKHQVMAPTSIDIDFQKEAPPVIDFLSPVDGSKFAQGKSVQFLCRTLHGAEIMWDFGDGDSAFGDKPKHTYASPGTYSVAVTVTAPNDLTTTAKLSLEVLDISVGVKNPGDLFADVPFEVKSKSRGSFTLFEWVIDGRKDVGEGSRGEDYEGLFNSPGEHTIQVIGVHPQTKIYSDTLVVNVDVAPSIIIESPTRGATFKAGQEIECIAGTESSSVEAVRWVVLLKNSGEEIFNSTVPVGSDSRSSIIFTPNVNRDAMVDVVATVVLKNGDDGPSDSDSWTIKYPEVSAKISVSGGKRFDDPVSFALESDSAVDVVWSFGDGEVEKGKNFNPSHVYDKYGKFEVKATVTGRGGKRGEAFAYVDIPYTAPVSMPAIEVAGVSVSTVKLGDTADLADASVGDIVSEQWFLNGEPLSSSKRSLIFDERGVNTLLLQVTGPAGANGEKPEVSKGEIEFRVVEYNHGLFWTILAAILVIFWLIFRIFTGNGPAAWKLTIGHDEERATSRRLKSKWSMWHKRAEFKISRFFTEEQWLPGPGCARGEHTVVISGKKGSSTVQHSGTDGGPAGKVQLAPPLSTQGLTSRYTVTDYDDPELDNKTYYIWLKRDKKTNLGHAFVLLLLFAVTLTATYFLYRKVYLGF
jgi:PKD repeat protein